MYYSELPDCIKYKVIRWPKIILQNILDKHNSRSWANMDYMFYKEDDTDCLLLEKTQEEIVQEIKDWCNSNIEYLKSKTDSLVDLNWLISSINLCTYVIDFESYSKYFTLSDVYPECFEKPIEYKPVIIDWKKIELPNPDDVKRINILLVLDKLWIEYKRVASDTYALYDNWQWTDWWRANTKQNIVSDFSSKWRPHWNPLNLAVEYLNLSVKETLLRFKDNNLC